MKKDSVHGVMTFKFSPEFSNNLRMICFLNDRTLSEYVESTITREWETHGPDPAAFKAMFEAAWQMQQDKRTSELAMKILMIEGNPYTQTIAEAEDRAIEVTETFSEG